VHRARSLALASAALVAPPPQWRAGREPGPGLLFRVARQLQPRFIASPPAATGPRQSIGKWAR
jgi:hypothetical protein